MLAVLVLAVAVAGSPLPQHAPSTFSSPPVGDGGTTQSDRGSHTSGMSDIIILKKPEGGGQFQPANGQFQPATDQFQPASGQFQPANGQFQPANGQFQPANGQFQPANGQFQPTSGQFQPASGQFQPGNGQFQPASGQFQPASGLLQLESGQIQPISGQFQPRSGQDKIYAHISSALKWSSTTSSSLEDFDKIEDNEYKVLSTNNERKSRLLFDSNADNQLHASNFSKIEAIDASESPNPNLKITHRVSHVIFEVSEVGPSRSTLPLPTVVLNATQPIPVILSRNLTTTTMAPVFVPKISVDGRPLPRSHDQNVEEAPPIPTIQPADDAETADSPKVVSGYASMTIGPKQAKQNDTFLSDDPNVKLPLDADGLGAFPDSQTSPPSILSKRKSELKAYLSDLQGVPRESSTKASPVLDLIGYEHDIESLLPKYMIETKNVSTATFEPSVPTATTPSVGLLESSSTSFTPTSPEMSTIAETTTSSSMQHDKPFKREAVDKSSNKLRFSDSSYSDYEKEDSNLFSFDPSNRDPRIYIDYTDIEAEKAKHKKSSAKMVSSTQPPVVDEAKIRKAELLESKQLKKQNETGTYETVVFSDELGKAMEPHIPSVRSSTVSSSVTPEELSPSPDVFRSDMDSTKVEEEAVVSDGEDLELPHLVSVMKDIVKLDNSSQIQNVHLQETEELEDDSLLDSSSLGEEQERDTSLKEGASVSEAHKDESPVEELVNDENESPEAGITDAPVTEAITSQNPVIIDKPLNSTERKSTAGEDHGAGPTRKEPSELGSPDPEEPHLQGSHPKVASEEDDFFAVSPPSAAAVAEAAVLTHFPVDRSKESRALDSRLTADKQVHQFVAPSAAPRDRGGAQATRGVSAAVASSDVNMGYVTAVVCGVLLAMLLIIGLGLFIHSQRRNLNRPKALSCDRGYAGSDSGGYLDDQCQSSYTTSHLDIPKGCSDDVISLDNDSFLNSLESMTIQNLWTDNIKHTKL